MAKQGVGAKYDAGKLRVGLLLNGLAYELEEIAAVLTYGGEKYAAHSWQNVPEGRERYFDALGRHLLEISKGHVLDDESGLRHVAHMACDLLFIMYLDRHALKEEMGDFVDGVAFEKWLLTYNPPPAAPKKRARK